MDIPTAVWNSVLYASLFWYQILETNKKFSNIYFHLNNFLLRILKITLHDMQKFPRCSRTESYVTRFWYQMLQTNKKFSDLHFSLNHCLLKILKTASHYMRKLSNIQIFFQNKSGNLFLARWNESKTWSQCRTRWDPQGWEPIGAKARRPL